MSSLYVEENDGASVRKADWFETGILTNRWQIITNLFSWRTWFSEPFGSDKHKVMVSTVFLGIDHNFITNGPPVLYETMIFAGKSWDDLYQERYCTRTEAIDGHKNAVKIAKTGCL